jgi:hypothetical protein
MALPRDLLIFARPSVPGRREILGTTASGSTRIEP